MANKLKIEKPDQKWTVSPGEKRRQKKADEKAAATDLETIIRRIVEEVVEEKLKAVYEYIYEIEDQMPDPDEGKTLKPEVETELRERISRNIFIPAEEVHQRLGLDE